MIAGSLEIQLLANMARLQKDMDQAKGMVGGAMKNIESTVASAKRALGALGIGVGFGALIASLKSVADHADNIGKTAQKIGITTESLSALQYAGKLADVSMEQLSTGMKRLSANMLDMSNGTGEAQDAFRALGISVTESNGQLKAGDKVLIEVAERFANMEDGADKTALAMKLFGKSGAEMIPLLNAGASGLKDMSDEAKRLGLIISLDTAKAAEQFNDNLTRLTARFDGIKLSLGQDVLPLLVALTNGLTATEKKTYDTDASFSVLRETLRALIVIGGNVAFVLKSVGNEIGGIAAQIVAFASGDFKGAFAIGDMMKEDAKKARAEFDAWEKKMMEVGNTSATTTSAVQKQGFAIGDTGKASEKAAKAYEAVQKKAADFIASLEKESAQLGLTATQKKMMDAATVALTLKTDKERMAVMAAALAWAEEQRKIDDVEEAKKRASEATKEAIDLHKSEEEAIKSLSAARAQSTRDYGDLIDQMELETRTLGMTSEQRERYIALKKLDREYTLGLIETEADYLARVNQINAAFEKRDAAKQYLDDHTSLWNSIESTAHDTFISIFDSGKSAFDRLRDTLKNGLYELLYQMTLKKWIFNISASGSGSGVGGTVSNALGGGGNTGIGGFNPLGSIGNSVVGAIGGMGGFGAGFASGISEAALGASFVGPSASLAGGSVGLGATFAAAIPWVAVAVAVASLLMKEGGGPKIEGNAMGVIGAGGAFDFLHNASFAAPFGDGDWGRPGADAARVQQMLAPVGTAVYQAIRDLGGDATGLGLALGYNTDPQGTAPDNVMGTVRDASGNEVYRNVFDAERGQGAQAMGEEIQRVMLAALQATDLVDVVDAYLDTIDIKSLTGEQAAAALKYVKALDDTGKAMERLGFGADSLTPTLINAAGGLESLQASLSSFYDLYYTETEKQAMAQADLVAQFEALNLALPESKDAFRKLVEGIDRSTTAGEEMFVSLLKLGPAFAQVVDVVDTTVAAIGEISDSVQAASDQYWAANAAAREAEEEAARIYWETVRAAEAAAEAMARMQQGLRSWLHGLDQSDLSPLTAQQQRDAAQMAYVEQLMRAQEGDIGALGNITQYADAYLRSQKTLTGFAGDYSAIFQSVRNQIDSLANGNVLDANQPLGKGDMEALKQEVADLRAVLARLLEIGNSDDRSQTEAIVDAIETMGERIAQSTTNATAVTERA